MLKRAGRAHDPLRVDSTEVRQCAVECPACPHPNRNLPEGWEQASPTQRFEMVVWQLVDMAYTILDGSMCSSSRLMPTSG
jgi:hypothetical protein